MSLTREVFDELVVGYLPHLYQLAKYRTDTFEEMQELVQDTLVKAFGARHQFEPGTNLRGWLVTILFNTFRDGLRRAHHRPPMISADTLEELDQRLGSALTRNQWYWQNPAAVEAHADLLRRVQDAINQLPSPFRQVTLMAAIEGCTYKEIAERVGCPIGTVMSRLSRGRLLLRNALKDDLDLQS